MATKDVTLSGLKVVDLKRELEERDLDTSGKKADLQQRLKEAMEAAGEDPDNYLFEVTGNSKELLKRITELWIF